MGRLACQVSVSLGTGAVAGRPACRSPNCLLIGLPAGRLANWIGFDLSFRSLQKFVSGEWARTQLVQNKTMDKPIAMLFERDDFKSSPI